MRNVTAALAAFCLLGLAVSLASCGAKATCSTSSCSGCCSSSGECVPGISNANCGKAGATCSACGSGNACQAGVCKATGTGGGGGSGGGSSGGGSSGGGSGGSGGGTGGGGTGGSAGAGGGGTGGGAPLNDGGCVAFTLVDRSSGGGYNPDFFGDGSYSVTRADLELPLQWSDAGTDMLYLEHWYAPGAEPAAPATRAITMATYNYCSDCVVARFGVTPSRPDGTTFFLARGGSIDVHAATYASPGGQLRATATNLHLVEWLYDTSNDQAVSNGRCFDITVATFDAGF